MLTITYSVNDFDFSFEKQKKIDYHTLIDILKMAACVGNGECLIQCECECYNEKMSYILEVQKFNPNGHNAYPEWNGKSENIGYMNKIFNTKQEASDYYDKFNPHMRPLHANNTWRSDWDPNSYLMYIVRERFYEYLKIPPFEDSKK